MAQDDYISMEAKQVQDKLIELPLGSQMVIIAAVMFANDHQEAFATSCGTEAADAVAGWVAAWQAKRPC